MYIDCIIELGYYIYKKKGKKQREKDIYYYIAAKLIGAILCIKRVTVLERVSCYILLYSAKFCLL